MTITIETNTEELVAKRKFLRKILKEKGVDVIIQNETNNRCVLIIDKAGLINERE